MQSFSANPCKQRALLPVIWASSGDIDPRMIGAAIYPSHLFAGRTRGRRRSTLIEGRRFRALRNLAKVGCPPGPAEFKHYRGRPRGARSTDSRGRNQDARPLRSRFLVKVRAGGRPSEKNGQKGRVRSQPSLLSSPCLHRLPQKCGALRLKPWSAVQRQTPRWRKADSNSQSHPRRARFRDRFPPL
jgi:hypothetical protein